MPVPAVPEALALKLGLSPAQWRTALERLGRAPSRPELDILLAAWSARRPCWSSRIAPEQLPTEGPRVLQGPGGGAGVVDLGDGWAAAFSLSSRPGALRDVLAAGARPLDGLAGPATGFALGVLETGQIPAGFAPGSAVLHLAGGGRRLETCQGLFRTGAIAGIQDIGPAGFAAGAFQLALRSGTGLALRLDPMDAPALLESLLLVARTEGGELLDLLRGRGLEAAVLGEITGSGRFIGQWRGETVIDLPIGPLAAPAPRDDRPAPADAPDLPLPEDLAPEAVDAQLRGLLAGQPSAGAGLAWIDGCAKALAVAIAGGGRRLRLDPFWGAAHAVAEACRVVACVGAEPVGLALALDDAAPDPGARWAQGQAILGIRQACLALEVPVVSGELGPRPPAGVRPALRIAAVGLVDDCAGGDGNQTCGPAFQGAGHGVFLLGGTRDELGGSAYLEQRTGGAGGACPELRLDEELRLQACVREGVRMGLIRSARAPGAGGLLVAVLASAFGGGLGCRLELSAQGIRLDALLFGECPGRIVVTVEPEGTTSLVKLAATHRVRLAKLGMTGGARASVLVDGVSVLDADADELRGLQAANLHFER